MLWGQNDSLTFFIRFTVSIRYGNIYNPTYLLELYGLIICFQYSIFKNDNKDLKNFSLKNVSLAICHHIVSSTTLHTISIMLITNDCRWSGPPSNIEYLLFCFQFMAKSFLNYSFHVLYVTFSFCCVLLGSL